MLPRVAEVEHELPRRKTFRWREQLIGQLPPSDRHHTATLGEPFPGSKVEGNAGPARVLYETAKSDEGLRLRARGDSRLADVTVVLPAHDVLGTERLEGVENLQGLGDERIGVEGRGRLHGHETEHLEEVRHDHVTERTHPLVKLGATLDRQCLRHVDLDVADVVAVPDELEDPVGETQGQDVLHGLLTEKVVDPVNLRLVEDAVHRLVEFARRFQVQPERLLQDDARPLVQPGRSQHFDDSGTRGGWAQTGSANA